MDVRKQILRLRGGIAIMFGLLSCIGVNIGTIGCLGVEDFPRDRVALCSTGSTPKIYAYLWDGSDFQQINDGTNTDKSGSYCALNATDLLIYKKDLEKICIYRWNGSKWFLIKESSEFVSNNTIWSACSRLSNNSIALIRDYNVTTNYLETYTFDGSDWSKTGNSFNFGSPASFSDISRLSDTDVVIWDAGDICTYTWDGTDWSLVNNKLSISDASFSKLCSLDSSTCAFLNINTTAGTEKLETYSWDGTDWSKVGNSLSLSYNATYFTGDITSIDDSTVIVFSCDNGATQYYLRTYSWDGTDWAQVGNDGTPASYSSDGKIEYLK